MSPPFIRSTENPFSQTSAEKGMVSLDFDIATSDLQYHAAVKEILSALGHAISPSGVLFMPHFLTLYTFFRKKSRESAFCFQL
ncbi:MAG: hypothetical protein IIX85_09605 [Clostridia bacterium]|nr:hypothetical protein [Clostridia bacterium]MBQ5742649.1 hypothetical protein [Clostridia bacterium]